MNSLRYLVSSSEEEGESPPPAAAAAQRKAVLKQHTPPPSLLWQLIYRVFPPLSERKPSSGAAVVIEVSDSVSSMASSSSSSSSKNNNNKTALRRRKSSSSASTLPSIPRLLFRARRKTLVLDLDETLIHSMTRGHNPLATMVEVHLKNAPVSTFYYVTKRPHCSEFLQSVLQWYEVCIFTASVREYADPIVDMLERDLGWPCFKRRFYRDSCMPLGSGSYAKDLRVLQQDLSQVLLVDNSPVSFWQSENGLPIEGWISDPSDRCLLHLLPLLYSLRHTSDVRSVLCLRLGELPAEDRSSDLDY